MKFLISLTFFAFLTVKGLSQCPKNKKYSYTFFTDWRRDTLECKIYRKKYDLRPLLSENKYSDSKSIFFGYKKKCILRLLGKPDYPSENNNEIVYLLGKNCNNANDKSFATFGIEFKNQKVVGTFMMIYD